MTSNTGDNRSGTFQKGDPRINRKGRPKSFDALRALAQTIAHETATDAAGKPQVVNGKIVTVTEAVLRQWAAAKNPDLQRLFMEIAYGKVPNVNELTGRGGGPVVLKVVYDERVPDPSAEAAQ